MATHVEDFNVQRITWESKIPIKVALTRLDTEVNAGVPLYFEKMLDKVMADGADWEMMSDKFEEVVGPSGFM